MRVITGDFRGRRFKAVPGNATRPTSDKIKEAVFQIMGPFFDGGKCLDLFAGSGSLGIEALSRGMDHTTFVDKQAKAIKTIKENITVFKIEERSRVIRGDAFQTMRRLSREEESFDLILVDPPYEHMNYEDVLENIVELNLVSAHGLIYCEHEADKVLPETLKGFSQLRQTTYGSTTGITIYYKNT